MSNINRDYLVVIDVKSGTMNKPSMVFYNTDKNTSNIYAQLVVKETIVHATPIENATDFVVELKVIKPENIVKMMTGTLVNEAEAIYEFDLPVDFINLDGTYAIEFWVKAKVADREEVITSSRGKYTVKASILTDLDEAIEDHEDYPLFLKLMEEVKVINETAHELDTTIRTLQSDMIDANNEMKANEEQRKANEVLRETNEGNRVAQENAREEYLNAFDGKWQEYKANTDADIADYKAQINAQESVRNTQEQQRQANEQQRITNENDRIYKEDRRESQERDRVSNEYDRQNNEQDRVYAENTRTANEEIRQTNEANREANEVTRETNEQARITAENARVTEHEQMRTELNEVRAENAILMENDKKQADRMTQVEISDKRQYVIMEGLMNSAGDGYLKIEDTGNDTTLYNSVEGFVDVKNIVGNTMVNSIKNPDDELTLNADINTSGQSVTLTTAVDNGQVDILAEGNTMVNVCDQQEAVAITKSYTVETGNHVALQGEFDGKARPVPTGNTLVNIVQSYNKGANTIMLRHGGLLKTNTTYTLIAPAFDSNVNEMYVGYNGNDALVNYQSSNVVSFNTGNSILSDFIYCYYKGNDIVTYINNVPFKYILLEGDYTNKPIPDYFTGIQSSFEDKLVTQEMVDSGKELAENLGKYKVEYKVTGKNKFNKDTVLLNTKINSDGTLIADSTIHTSDFIKVNPNTIYTKTDNALYSEYDNDKKFIRRIGNSTFTTGVNCHYVRLHVLPDVLDAYQLEEGSTATQYETYRESIKTYYLNSPLLEGDTIEESNGNVYHVHRYWQYTFTGLEDWKYESSYTNDTVYGCFFLNNGNITPKMATQQGAISDILPTITITSAKDFYLEGVACNGATISLRINKSKLSSIDLNGFKTWLQSNPVTSVYQLASPQYELISQSDTILTDSYVAGHLDFDTAVPIEKVKFNGILFKLKYWYPSTNYIVQFEADDIGKIDLLNINGNYTGGNIVKGLNKFTLTTPSTVVNNYMDIYGIGCNISNIVVTEATDKDFGYFSGMKSVGELEENKIEILSSNKNIFDSSNFSLSSSSAYLYITNSIINDDGCTTEFSSYNGWCNYRFEGLDPSKTYTISYKATGNVSEHRLSWYINENFYQARSDKIDTVCSNTVSGIDFVAFGFKMSEGGIVTVYDIQIEEGNTATDYVPQANNKKQILLNEPLRAVGDTKDRFVQIDGKWYVERNCEEINSLDLNWVDRGTNNEFSHGKRYIYADYINGSVSNHKINVKCAEYVPIAYSHYDFDGECIYVSKDRVYMYINTTLDSFLTKNIKFIIISPQPTYEPVEIAPTVNTYTDVTHITNNSTIPMNMPIVNSGYEVIVKPSTKYTVVGIDNGRIGDSTIVNGTITTPATITDNFLRPYGTGKTSKVMLLEGEPANIPGYFKGIKSVFEDKVTEDGKYAVEVKVIGKNLFDGETEKGSINNLGELLNSNAIRSKNYINVNPSTKYKFTTTNYTATVYISEYDGSHNFLRQIAIGSERIYTSSKLCRYIKFNTNNIAGNDLSNTQIEEGTVASEYEPYHETKQTLYLDEPLYNTNNITIYNDKLGYWKNYDIRDYQDGDFGTYLTDMTKTVYQLAEPVFVPVIDNCPNFVIGSWDNCSIHFDSIIPLKDTRYRYTGNVPSVVTMSEDVAETKSISDEQDALLVDMATELAVMKLTM